MSVQGKKDGKGDIVSERKFFYGDTVELISALKYPRHVKHKGVVVGTKIYKNPVSKVIYTVQCECGQELRPQAPQLSLISENPMDLSSARIQNFTDRLLEAEGLEVSLSWIELGGLLSALRETESSMILMRYGLDGKGTRTLQEIADMRGVSRQNVYQIIARAMKKLRREYAVSRKHVRESKADIPGLSGVVSDSSREDSLVMGRR